MLMMMMMMCKKNRQGIPDDIPAVSISLALGSMRVMSKLCNFPTEYIDASLR